MGQQGRRYSIFAWYAAGRAEYLFNGVPLRPSVGVDFGINSGDNSRGGGHIGTFRAPFPPGRYVGTDVTLAVTYRAGPHTTLEAKAARFFAGGFLADNRPNRDTSYFELTTSYRF